MQGLVQVGPCDLVRVSSMLLKGSVRPATLEVVQELTLAGGLYSTLSNHLPLLLRCPPLALPSVRAGAPACGEPTVLTQAQVLRPVTMALPVG